MRHFTPGNSVCVASTPDALQSPSPPSQLRIMPRAFNLPRERALYEQIPVRSFSLFPFEAGSARSQGTGVRSESRCVKGAFSDFYLAKERIIINVLRDFWFWKSDKCYFLLKNI